jgi:Squalene-hopene cyclase C-terminal domain
MDSANRPEPRGNLSGIVRDAGLLVSLLAALIAVQVIDRLHPDKGHSVDLVFLLDQRPSMRDYLEAMKANCLEKAEALKSEGFDGRFAVIPFSPGKHRIPSVPLTDDLDTFKERLNAPPNAQDAGTAATGGDALEKALGMDFRKDTSVLFFLISKSPFKEDKEVAGIAGRIAERGVTVIVQADPAAKDLCRPLYQSGGRFFSMEGSDLTEPSVASSNPSKAEKTSSRAGTLLAKLATDNNSLDPSKAVKVKGIYVNRDARNRQQSALRMGGSPESEAAVKDGLAWLARHQADDGYWSAEEKCEKDQPCQTLNVERAMVAQTGLALLAFQAGGNYYFNDEKYSPQVTRGLDWLVKQQKSDGSLFGQHSTWYEHGMSTFALAEACAIALAYDEDAEPRYLDAATRAIGFMERHQYAGGGWRYDLDGDGVGDTSVSGWQVLALKSAMEAKIEVSPKTIERVQHFYESCGDTATGLTGYQHRNENPTDATTAVGLIVQEFILHQPKSPLAQRAVEHLKTRAAAVGQNGDCYTLYNGTLAMFLARGDAWQQWNQGVRDALVQRQEKTGCARGSWTDRYGRTLGTSWAVLTLEVYYRYATGENEGDEKAATIVK